MARRGAFQGRQSRISRRVRVAFLSQPGRKSMALRSQVRREGSRIGEKSRSFASMVAGFALYGPALTLFCQERGPCGPCQGGGLALHQRPPSALRSPLDALGQLQPALFRLLLALLRIGQPLGDGGKALRIGGK